jgi:hypothetical protein
MVIVEVADEPVLTVAGDVAAILKSGAAPKVNVAVAEWEREPLVPAIVTVKLVAEVEEHERVAVPEPVTLLGVIDPHVSPAGTVSVRVTLPANPFCPVTVIVEEIDDPTVPEGEVAAIVKSTTVNVAVAEWVMEPLAPVTVRT